jgi:hypothetical protein
MDFGDKDDWKGAFEGGQGRTPEDLQVAAYGIGIAGMIFIAVVALAIVYHVVFA